MIARAITDVLFPSDLDMLKRVFDRFCADTGTLPNSPAAEAIASHMVALFEGGYEDETDLLDALNSYEFQKAG